MFYALLFFSFFFFSLNQIDDVDDVRRLGTMSVEEADDGSCL